MRVDIARGRERVMKVGAWRGGVGKVAVMGLGYGSRCRGDHSGPIYISTPVLFSSRYSLSFLVLTTGAFLLNDRQYPRRHPLPSPGEQAYCSHRRPSPFSPPRAPPHPQSDIAISGQLVALPYALL